VRPADRTARPPSNENVQRLLARQPWASLRPFLASEGDTGESRLGALRAYAQLLLEWNQGVSNLVSHNDETRLVERHILESLHPAAMLIASGCRRFVDLGSGAGLPAIPLSIAGVGEHWTLVESRRNKTLFLRRAKQEMKLKNIEVITGRLEMLVEESPEALQCDGFTSRATMTIGPTLELAARIVEPDGLAFLWKGSRYADEMPATSAGWSRHWDFVEAHVIADGPNVVAVFKRNQKR